MITSAEQTPDTGHAAAPCVLVVDDDRDMLAVMRGALEDEGLHVETAENGLQALSIARHRKPALVILDVTLPDVDSGHVAAHLRQTTDPAIPLLVITADGAAAAKARRLGAYAYLRKPFDLGRLISEVLRGLGQTQSTG